MAQEQALWYVVHTYSGYENKVATNLETIVENRRLQDLDSGGAECRWRWFPN